MISSMTAYARKDKQADWGHAVWELRSVNHRFLEINFSLPEPFNYLEPLLRQQLSQRVHRGKLDVKLRYQVSSKSIPLEVDESLADSIIEAYTKLAKRVQVTRPLNPSELLHWPNILKLSANTKVLESQLLALFAKALDDLCSVKQTEGEALFAVIWQRLVKLHDLIQKLAQQLPHLLSLQRKKILARFSELNLSLEANRLEQEIVFFMQKTDVAEEIDRLQIHLNESKKLLEKNNVCGKQLDFLLQELNREANTLASKSLNAHLNLLVVNMKTLIEESREQVQNIE
jgi:uncharacterized protein (TIGR00255 family)